MGSFFFGMKILHLFSRVCFVLCSFSMLFPMDGQAVESGSKEWQQRYPFVPATALPVEEMDMEKLASTFGAKYPLAMWRKSYYPAAVAQLDLSDVQKGKLIDLLRVSKVAGLTEEFRTQSISRLYEHWGKNEIALKELESSSPSLHRVRLLLKGGRRSAAVAEAKRYFKISKERGFKRSYHTGFSIVDLTHPYVAVGDYRGMKNYLDLLAELAPERQDLFFAQLDLAYHLGNLDHYAAQLQKEKPIHFILYLQHVERYTDALEALTLRIKHEPLTHSQVVFLAPYFRNHEIIQKQICDMISSGEGGEALREKLIIALSGRNSYRLKSSLTLWMQTHPDELDRWAIHFAFKLIPITRDDMRYGRLLDDLYKRLPDNPVLGLCMARKLLAQQGRSVPSVNKILSTVVRDHLQKPTLKQAILPAWSMNPSDFLYKEKQLSEPAAMALAMLSSRLDANALYHLLHESSEFSKLPAAQKARYYAIARLDRPFLETMLTLDWSLPENDDRARWLHGYFNSFDFKENIPAEYLDQLAEKISDIAMGSSEKYKRNYLHYDFKPLIQLLFAKHPHPETLRGSMENLALEMKKCPDLNADGQFAILRSQLKNIPMIENIFPLKQRVISKGPSPRDGGVDARRSAYATVLFSAPDIKRLQSIRVNDWSVRSYSIYAMKRSKKYAATIPIQYLKRRNVVYVRFWPPSVMEDSMRESYPKFSEFALAYDLWNRLLQSEEDPSGLYQFLDTLPKDDPDLILFKAAIQIAHEASDEEVLSTLARLKSAPVTQRKRAMKLIQNYDKASKSRRTSGDPKKWKVALGEKISKLIAIESPVGLVEKPDDYQKKKEDDSVLMLKVAGEKLIKFRNEKQYQSEECQELARKVLWGLANGDASMAGVTHYRAISAMLHVGGFKKFLTEVEADLKKKGMNELQQWRILRRFYSYRHSKQKSVKLAYSQKIQQLDPDDFIAASDLLPVYVGKRDGVNVMHCLKVIATHSSDTVFLRTLKSNDSFFSLLGHDQVGELLDTTLRLRSWTNRQDSSKYLSSFLPKCSTKNKVATLEYLKWLKREDIKVFDVELLGALLKMGVRDLTVQVIAEQVFPSGVYSRSSKVPLRFSKPQVQPNGHSRSSYNNKTFSLIVQYDLAGAILKLSRLELEKTPVNFIMNRFIMEVLASPMIDTYNRIAPYTVEKVSALERNKMCVEVRLLLDRISGSEPLQLSISQAMLDPSKKQTVTEISLFFKLAYLSRDVKAVEDVWKNVDLLAEKQKNTNGSVDYFKSMNEFCLLATLRYGNDQRWKKLISVMSQKNRYEDDNENLTFHLYVFRNLEKILNHDLTSISPERGQDLLGAAIENMNLMKRRPNRNPNWTQWTLLAARCGDDRSLKYFHQKSKQQILSLSSDSDFTLDELDFWISFLKGDPSLAHPVIHAYQSGQQWNVLWTFSGLPLRRGAVITPGDIIPQKVGFSDVEYSLTILAGPTPDRLEVVKTISKASGSGSAPIPVPQGARWLGLMAKFDGGKSIRWATPIKLRDASAPRVNIKDKISQQPSLGVSLEWADKDGPFHAVASARLSLPDRQEGVKNIKLFPLSWTPGAPLFASAWIKQKNRESASLAIGFYDESNNFLGSRDLLVARSNYSSILRTSSSTDYWAYACTARSGSRNFTIPPRTHHAVFMVKAKSASSYSRQHRLFEFADVRIQSVARPEALNNVRRVGRVPGAMYYLSVSDDEQRMVLAERDVGIWIFDMKSGTSSQVVKVKDKAKVLWASVRGRMLYYVDDKHPFRCVDLDTGKEVFHQSLSILRNDQPKVALSPDAKWLAVGDNRLVILYHIVGNEIVKMKNMALPDGLTKQQFHIRFFNFDASSNLVMLGSQHYWKYDPKSQTLEKLGTLIRPLSRAPFDSQWSLFFEQPFLFYASWFDPIHKQYITIDQSNQNRSNIVYSMAGQTRTFNLKHKISAYTFLPNGGHVLYVDHLGILWKVVPSGDD